jgi:hypothetical protein
MARRIHEKSDSESKITLCDPMKLDSESRIGGWRGVNLDWESNHNFERRSQHGRLAVELGVAPELFTQGAELVEACLAFLIALLFERQHVFDAQPAVPACLGVRDAAFVEEPHQADVQTALILSGSSDAKTHQRYLRNATQMKSVPANALPVMDIGHVQTKGAGEEIRAAAPRAAYNVRDASRTSAPARDQGQNLFARDKAKKPAEGQAF